MDMELESVLLLLLLIDDMMASVQFEMITGGNGCKYKL
jgi:hypothetical protein